MGWAEKQLEVAFNCEGSDSQAVKMILSSRLFPPIVVPGLRSLVKHLEAKLAARIANDDAAACSEDPDPVTSMPTTVT